MWQRTGSSEHHEALYQKIDSPDWSSHQRTLRGTTLSGSDASVHDPPEQEVHPGTGFLSHANMEESAFSNPSRPFSSHSDWSAEGFRTASRENSIPMSHPTPDLQALQGAYVGNIERLEQHAERMSMSSDVGEELRKLRQEQKRSDSRRSSVLRSPPLSMSSRVGNGLTSPIRASQFSERDGLLASPQSPRISMDSPVHPNPRDDDLVQSPSSYISSTSGRYNLRNRGPLLEPHQEEQERPPSVEFSQLYDAAIADLNRHPSVASKNTTQQADDAFAEFDGTHIQELKHPPKSFDQGETSKSTLKPRPSSQMRQSKTPPPGMVFYPAPVPAVINLPAKLSKRPPATQVAQRASNILHGSSKSHDSGVPRAQSSASQNDQESGDIEDTIKGASLPPQLRASAFFDSPSQTGNLQLQNGSAIATLDMLLDASVHAPVSAFTDHLMVGQLGDEVYGASRASRRNISSETKPHSHVSSDHASHSHPDDPESDPDNEPTEPIEEQPEDDLTAKPATLLAELQRRKKQQASRNKTAANAFPRGMHATLLEMDTVAEVQKQARKHKTVTLAWEEGADDQVVDDDENVPLGLLHARSQGAIDDDQPLGILARRQAEDNEPLAARRARLRGEPVVYAKDDRERRGPAAGAEPPNAESEGEDAGETLAQRKRRLRIEQAIPKQKDTSSDFASEMLGQLGVPKSKPVVEEEESLAQRRERLKREKGKAKETAPATSKQQPPPPVAGQWTGRDSVQFAKSEQPPAATGDARTAMVDRWRQSIT
jgi:hypothetical protein